MMQDPTTRGEWQDAADAAHGALCLDAARQYGLVTGGPKVNVDRCEQILRKAAALGIRPARDSIERFAASCLSIKDAKDVRPRP